MDTSARWWGTAELYNYIDDWQDRIQEEHELVWGTSTLTATGSTTYTLTDFGTDVLRPGRIYYTHRLLVPKTEAELEKFDLKWRGYGTTTQPRVVYQRNEDTFIVWPPTASTNTDTVILEYPKQLDFATTTSTMALPAWTKYSVKSYAAFRAYLRRGPNQDHDTALRYRDLFYSQLESYGRIKRRFFPKRPVTIRPSSGFELDFLEPFGGISSFSFPSNAMTVQFLDEEPTGDINGTNTTFVLSTNPDPALSLELELDGVVIYPTTHYTLSSNTITTIGAPITGQSLFARYRYTS